MFIPELSLGVFVLLSRDPFLLSVPAGNDEWLVSQGLFTASQLHLVGIVFKGENRAGVLSEKTFGFQGVIKL